jgi:hypothetical protein
VEFSFTGEIIYWRGPAPFWFVAMPVTQAETLRQYSGLISYGWGCIPASVKIGDTEVTTALFPKAGTYYVPIKIVLQRAEKLELGHSVMVTVQVDICPGE